MLTLKIYLMLAICASKLVNLRLLAELNVHEIKCDHIDDLISDARSWQSLLEDKDGLNKQVESLRSVSDTLNKRGHLDQQSLIEFHTSIKKRNFYDQDIDHLERQMQVLDQENVQQRTDLIQAMQRGIVIETANLMDYQQQSQEFTTIDDKLEELQSHQKNCQSSQLNHNSLLQANNRQVRKSTDHHKNIESNSDVLEVQNLIVIDSSNEREQSNDNESNQSDLQSNEQSWQYQFISSKQEKAKSDKAPADKPITDSAAETEKTKAITDKTEGTKEPEKVAEKPKTMIDPTEFKPFKHKAFQSTQQSINKSVKMYQSTSGPAYDKEFTGAQLQDTDEYGYGYWLRAQPLASEQNPNYEFLSRLTSNKEFLDFQNYGDRTLALFKFKNALVFASYDYQKREKNKVDSINLQQSITNRWYFVSFSYSQKLQKSIGYVLLYGKDKINKKVEIIGLHNPPFYFRFLVGGKHQHYNQIDGQFCNIYIDLDAPAFIESEKDLIRMAEENNPPPYILVYAETQIIGPPREFQSNKNDNVSGSLKENGVFMHYSVSGWFRWKDTLMVKDANQFQIISIQERLQLSFIYGGAPNNVGIGLSMHSADLLQPDQLRQLKYQQFLWTYYYIAYDGDAKTGWAVFIKPGWNEELEFKSLIQIETGEIAFIVGGSASMAAFNGQMAFTSIQVGPEAVVKDKDMQYRFQYGDGASNLFQLSTPLIMRAQETTIEAAYDEKVLNQIVIHSDSVKINGQSEYSFGLWFKFVRSWPKYTTATDFQIARLGTQPKIVEVVKDELRAFSPARSVKDRTLYVSLSDKLTFSSYTSIDNTMKDVQTKAPPEGTWTYLYFGYRNINNIGIAKGYTQIGTDIQEVELKVQHFYLLEYLEFYLGYETAPSLNGYYANVQLRIGPEAFLSTVEIFKNYQLLEKFQIPVEIKRSTVNLLKLEQYPSSKVNLQEFVHVGGPNEYSVSGWMRYAGSQQSGKLHNVVTFIMRRQRDITKLENCMFLHHSDQQFIIGSITKAQQQVTVDFGEYWDQWIFYYMGYKQGQIYTLLQFPFSSSPNKLTNIEHQFLEVFTISLGSGIFGLADWIGPLKSWVLNIGTGSYQENNYDKDETTKLNFGFDLGSDHVKHQLQEEESHPSAIVNCNWNEQGRIPIHLEKAELSLNGVSAYSVGLWSRLRYYGQKAVLQDVQWLSLFRLTRNKQFKDDPSDRVLQVLQGMRTQKFTTYSQKNPVEGELPYQSEWESEWVYTYYGYRRISQEKGEAVGYVIRGSENTVLKQEAMHLPLNDYILLLVGNIKVNTVPFNGQISNVKLALGQSSFIDNPTLLKIQAPLIQPYVFRKYVVVESKQSSIAVNNSPMLIDSPANEYAAAVWFKIPENVADQHQVIFRLTSNKEPTQLIGERVLQLSKPIKSLEFRTYSLPITKEQKSASEIQFQCVLPKTVAYLWTFAYMGYRKQDNKLYYHMKAGEVECKAQEKALHAIADRYYFHVASDGILSRFIGQLAQTTLTIGDGSYNEKIAFLPEYLAAAALFPAAQKAIYQNNELITISDVPDNMVNSIKVEMHNGAQYQIEGSTQYAYGFWSQFLTAIPQRQFRKANIMEVARLGDKLIQKTSTMGERILATHLIFGKYQFTTYDLTTEKPIVAKHIEYKELEGVWRYIHMSYSREKSIVQCAIYDTQVTRMEIPDIVHRPVGEILIFHIGREENAGFQGRISKISLQVGEGAYQSASVDLKTIIETNYALRPELRDMSVDREKQARVIMVKEVSAVIQQEDKGEKYSMVSEYSIAGWFKYQGDGCQVLFRLTNNDKSEVSDRKFQGDRTLFAEFCGQLVKYSTYTLLNQKDFNDAGAIDHQKQVQDYHNWNYIYMGYNYRSKEVHILLHMIQGDQTEIIKDIVHIVPKYLCMTVGYDRFNPKWQGTLQQWTAQYGYGAFISLLKEGFPEHLPQYQLVASDVRSQWSLDVPIVEQPMEKIFTNEVEQVSEYAFGVWTRFFSEFPTKLLERKDMSIARLTSEKQHTDKTKLGDRVLSIFLIESYVFGTYDLASKNPSIQANVPYTQLEGTWTYLYTGHRKGQFIATAITNQSPKAERALLEVQHFALSGFARLLLAAREFTYESFHGRLYDPRLFFGQGAFLSDSQSIVEMIQKTHRPLPEKLPPMEDFKWPLNYVDSTIQEQQRNVDYVFDKCQYAPEYGVSLWVQQAVLLPDMADEERIIFRFATNQQLLKQSGDTTLVVSAQSKQITFTTYEVEDPPKWKPSGTILQIVEYQWTFIYFAYRRPQANTFLLQVTGPQQKVIPALHVVPNIFYINLIKDAQLAKFYGKLANLKVYFGSNAYQDEPIHLVDKWPFDQKLLPKLPEQVKEQAKKEAEAKQVKKYI